MFLHTFKLTDDGYTTTSLVADERGNVAAFGGRVGEGVEVRAVFVFACGDGGVDTECGTALSSEVGVGDNCV